MSRIKQVIDALEAERADVQERLAWLDRQIAEFREYGDNGVRATPEREDDSPLRRNDEDVAASAPKRSMRRATARRASTRRATARERQGDVKGQILKYLAGHPESTAGDVAKAVSGNRNTISTRLSKMARDGEIVKADKGYAAK
jgi:hypothetical protein